MYAFDELGNVLIDNTQGNQIEIAQRNRTLSRRAHAFVNNQFIPFQPLSETTWRIFSTRMTDSFNAICRNMKTPVRAAPLPRGPGDLRSLYAKIVTDWVSTDLQGFKGALPVVEIAGQSEMIFLVPADGAVIRYLGRLMRKHPRFFDIYIGRGDGFMSSRVTTIDGSQVVFGDVSHCMAVRVKERFSEGTGRFENNVNLLRGFKRILELDKIIPGLNKVFSTISRKLRNNDGSWGESPRFPIVDFSRKINLRGWDHLISVDENFHGNRKDLYSDRSVYEMIDPGIKYPFGQALNSSGEYKWIKPRA